jgi:hypothetical protein
MSPIAALIILLGLSVTANAKHCPNLGTAANFTVLSYSGVTNVGFSVITGNLGVYAIPSVTAFGPGIVTGGIQLATPATKKAQTDEAVAYTFCKSLSPTKVLSGVDLAGQTLAPGVYSFASTAMISAGGTLTLKGAGTYIFQVGSAITTGANTKVVVTGGATAGCVFWQVGSSVTHGASGTFLGTILAYASVTFGSGVTYIGSMYAQTGDVTLIDDAITQAPRCNVC